MGVRELNKVLKQIAEDFDLDGAALVKYAREDTIKGQDDGNPDGTAYTSDGKLLYALVRGLKPESVLEIGTYHGGSANHIAHAIKKNGYGYVTTVDIWDGSGTSIATELHNFVTLIHQNVDDFIRDEKHETLDLKLKPKYDFIFEDGPHSEHSVHGIYDALPFLLKPGGLILSHDTATGMGQYIRNGMEKGGVDLHCVKFYEIPGNPCGMSVYQFHADYECIHDKDYQYGDR